MNYNDYKAAVERLRAFEETAWGDARQVMVDKTAIYDAEHDQTPASVEWMREIGLEAIDEGLCARGMLQVLVEDDGSYAMLYDGQESMVFKVNPTRGDVLRLLGVFDKKEVA